jgi:hypothetical protein
VVAAQVIRSVLDTHQVDARVEGISVLSLFQAFAPFAPARIVVPEAQKARALEILEPLLR